jgi:hypothetical protein
MRVNDFIFNTLSTPNASGASASGQSSSTVPFVVKDPNSFISHVSTRKLAFCPNAFISSNACIEVVGDLSVEYIENHFDPIHIGNNITAVLDSAMSSPAFSDSFKPEKVEGLYGPWNRVSYNTVQGGKGMVVSLSSAGALVLGSLLFIFYRSRSSESRKKLEEMKSTNENENESGTLDQQPRGDENEGNLSLHDISQVPEAVPLSLSILAASRVMESIIPILKKPLTPIIGELKSKKRKIEEQFSSWSFSSTSENNPDEESSSSSISTANQNAEVSGLFFDKEGNDLGIAPFSQARLHPHNDATDDIEAQSPSSKAKIAKAA